MELLAKKAFAIFKEKKVTNLHHANSVITACQFLKTGALISRGSMVRRELFQTPQESDKIDKKFGIWFDVFTDSVDIHERASTSNVYGPVLFVLNIDALVKFGVRKLWVTKLNPTKWGGKSYEDRWFTSIKELETGFYKGNFDQMIVFRNSGGEIPIKECLEKIILDDPQKKSPQFQVDFFSMAYGALRLAMAEGGIDDVQIVKRSCSSLCKCIEQYKTNNRNTNTMYLPYLAQD